MSAKAIQTLPISAVGSTAPLVVESVTSYPTPLLPGVIVTLSAGASLTYTVQVTGDRTSGSNMPSNWNAFDGMSGLTASANGTLQGKVTALRLTITSYTSGSAILAFVP